MSDSEKSSSANVSDSSKDLSTTSQENPPSVNTSQALPDMSQSLPDGIDLLSESSDEDRPFNLGTLRAQLDDEDARPAVGSFLEEITDDFPMFSEFPTVENQEIMNRYHLIDDALSESSDEDPPVNLRTLRQRIIEESAASQEKTLNSVEPSELNQSPWTFVCHLNSAKYLKFAVEVLSNPELSSQGLGRIDVDDNGFNITAQNSTYYVVGHLRLKPDGFRCTRPLNGKRFRFLEFSQELVDVQDEATLYLANRKETDRLYVRFLTEGVQDRYFVDMSSNCEEICKFPDMSLFFTATVPSDDFRIMIQQLHQQQAPQVSVDIKDNTATLRVGSDNSWTVDYPMLKADGSRAMEMVAGERYSTNFQWTNVGVAKTLQKASELDTEFVVLFHAGRPKNIILRFSLGDVGYLEFMRDSAVIVSSTSSQKITRG